MITNEKKGFHVNYEGNLYIFAPLENYTKLFNMDLKALKKLCKEKDIFTTKKKGTVFVYLPDFFLKLKKEVKEISKELKRSDREFFKRAKELQKKKIQDDNSQ